MRLVSLALLMSAILVGSAEFLDSRAEGTPASSATSEPVRAGRTLITLPDTIAYSPLERRILGLERERSAAIARADTAWLATVYPPDFEGIAANGRRIGRPDLFRVFGRDDPESRFTIDELVVRDYGGAAMVTGRLRTFAPGGGVRGDTRYLHVYVKRNGGWWLVRAQATLMPPPEKSEESR